MTEETMADTPQEGDIPFAPEVDADETATDSPAENNDTEDTQSAEGEDEENTQQDTDDETNDDDIEDGAGDGDGDGDDDGGDDDKKPFHEHPRWKQREEEWDERFNKQEERHQEDMRKLREEFSKSSEKKDEELKSEEAPSWFGGTPEQWKEFRDWNKQQIESVEKGALSKIDEAKSAEAKAVKEATDYFQAELKAIQGDKTLNPSGKKVDPNKLLKLVMDNELIDSKGRWNYRAGMKIMNADNPTKPSVPNNTQKKKIASATTSESKGETKPKAFKTSKDFKNNTPW